MQKIPCHYYASECQKILEWLNQKKAEGYIITKLDLIDGMGMAYFEETNQQFIYSLDYSSKYVINEYYFQEEDEYFDIAKLNGWKLQCYSKNIGIWINTDLNAMPFYLDEEYEEIKEQDFQKVIKNVKRKAGFLLFTYVLAISMFFKRGLPDMFYGLPMLIFYMYVVYQAVRHKRLYPSIFFTWFSFSFIATMYWLPHCPLTFAIGVQVILILIFMELLRKDSYLLKKFCYINEILCLLWFVVFICWLCFYH